jgi:signal transduction histidine kinase
MIKMVSQILDVMFLGAIGISFVAVVAVILFIEVFERLFDEEIYEKAFFAFNIFLLSMIFHTLYHLSGEILHAQALETLFEFMSLFVFFYGTAVITRSTMMSHISSEAYRNLQDQVEKKTQELKTYASDLERSNKLKDLFSDIISHDLLNPVGVIINYSDLMLEDEKEFNTENLDAVKRNAKRATRLIESARIFSRIQDGGSIEFTRMDLGALLREEIENLKYDAELKKIKFVSNFEGEYPIMASPFIKQIFVNLLSNSIKYSPDKSTISVGVDDGGGLFRIWVKDQGEGIETQFKESIFERFERKNKEGVKGSGLGLAIVKRIVEIHNGKVWVEDNPEGGSIFYVEIPREL